MYSTQKLSFANDDSCPEIQFSFQYDEPYSNELRSSYHLENLVKDCTTNLEKILKVTDWVHHLWEHNGNAVPTQSDPLSILKEVFEEKKQFRCVEYSIVLSGCLNALGISSRVVGLLTADVETREYGAGHVVTESYLSDFDKWIMIDCQENVVPVVKDIPLNAVELQQALAEKENISFVSWQACLSPEDAQSYIQFVEQYLYYFQTKLVHSYIPNKDAHSLMLVPIGAKNPTIFQRLHPLINVYYTHSAHCFYEKPKGQLMKFRTFKQDKLWRDKAVEIMEGMGSVIQWKRLDDQEFVEQLKIKLIEEVQEVVQATTQENLCEELADVLEVINAFCEVYNVSLDDVIKIQRKKCEKRGGFSERKFVTVAHHSEGGFGEKYCLADPEKYPEITEID